MKELSIEEKAQRYDEAIEKAKEMIKAMTNIGGVAKVDDIQYLFPELKEPDDEEIRKYIISFIELNSGVNLPPDDAKEMLAWLEKQGEQKSVGKVEPKFNVGNWVVSDLTGEVHKIARLSDKIYFEDGTYTDTLGNYHIWTIQDAKDGDVLYLQKDGKEHIIIYKGVTKERFRTFVSAYCAYNGIVDAFCFADVSRYVDIAYGGIMPATKEQRDTLFAKMREASYEWDAEKKELKKIIIPIF